MVAQREKIGHAALHPRKLHLWWARRPLAAARAAVYATLVPVEGTPDSARSDKLLRLAVSMGREREDDRRGPSAGACGQRWHATEGARPRSDGGRLHHPQYPTR
ncbi:MAG: DUF1156 domain-containing protein [Solirubrobacteraceae bacterium]